MDTNEPVKSQDHENTLKGIPDGYIDITQQLIDNAPDSPEYDPRSPNERDIPLKEWKKQIEEYFKTEEAQKEKEEIEKKLKEAKEQEEPQKQIKEKKKYKTSRIYVKNVINNRIFLTINEVGNNIDEIILQKLKNNYEGKCRKEGFIKSDSIKLITYSSGLVKNGNVSFDVVYECFICKPVEGMVIQNCIVKNVTKAGIRAETKEDVSPIVIFISRDHHYQNTEFSKIKENDSILIRVIGIRYELNDKYISIIGEFLDKFVPLKRKLKIKSN